MPLLYLVCAVALLFALIIVFKLNGFLSLLISAVFAGLLQGMPLLDIVKSIERGVGDTVGHLGLIIVLGAILGKLMSDGGGAQRIATTFINMFGKERVDWAMSISSFVLGAILFWDVSFVLLIPIVYTVAIEARVRLMRVGFPFLMAITIAHCFLPPHPGPLAVAGVFEANIGLVLLYGLAVCIPGIILFGPVMTKAYAGWNNQIPESLMTKTDFKEEELPGFGISLLSSLLPVILIITGVLAEFFLDKNSAVREYLLFIGNADVAMLISVLVAIYVFGLRGRKRTMKQMMQSVEAAMLSMGAIVFLIGGGGALKQVILDSGMSEYIAAMTQSWNISPLLLAWLMSACLKICLGSATVTVFTASAILLPILERSGANPELMVLAVATGSVFGGLPNEASFWLIMQYFNLSVVQTVKLWCVQASLLAIYGGIGVMILSLFIS